MHFCSQDLTMLMIIYYHSDLYAYSFNYYISLIKDKIK
jgi:hypothetical protein